MRIALERLEDEPFSELLHPVAVEHIGRVHLRGDASGGAVRGGACGVPGLLARLPEAERQALAPLVRVAFEVAEEAAYLQCLLVGAVVVLAQEVEIRLRPPHGAEGYQVESLEGAAGEGGPVKSVLD